MSKEYVKPVLKKHDTLSQITFSSHWESTSDAGDMFPMGTSDSNPTRKVYEKPTLKKHSTLTQITFSAGGEGTLPHPLKGVREEDVPGETSGKR